MATRQSTRDIPSTGEVADNDLGADCSQRLGTFIFATDKRADWQVALAKQLHTSAAHCAYAACGACRPTLQRVEVRALRSGGGLVIRAQPGLPC